MFSSPSWHSRVDAPFLIIRLRPFTRLREGRSEDWEWSIFYAKVVEFFFARYTG